jgi:hypothetical protein
LASFLAISAQARDAALAVVARTHNEADVFTVTTMMSAQNMSDRMPNSPSA